MKAPRISLLVLALLPLSASAPGGLFAAQRDLPDAVLRGVVFEGFQAGGNEFEVRASRADVSWKDGLARLRDVEILLVGDLERPVEVTAAEGIVYLESEDFELLGGVQGTTDRGERFETERVRFAKGSQELVGDGPVKVARDGLDFIGNGMRIDLETREIRFVGRVRATIAPK